MREEEQTKLYVEMWKQAIDVQKHFNDIELRVRGLALSVLTLVLGGASLAIQNNTTASYRQIHMPLASLILFGGTILWLTFYFVDQIWYHRLLLGAVKHGEELEDRISESLPGAGLTKAISESSPYPFKIRFFKWTLWEHGIHSTAKVRIFYFAVAGILLASGLVALVALQPPKQAKPIPLRAMHHVADRIIYRENSRHPTPDGTSFWSRRYC